MHFLILWLINHSRMVNSLVFTGESGERNVVVSDGALGDPV